MKKSSTYHLLDVFTDKKFSGNQLAVFPDSREIPEHMMQSIATEFNISETVYLFPAESDGSFNMRIFTPGQELPTAGHPTVGSAYYVATHLNPTDSKSGTIVFNQKVGAVEVDLHFEDEKLVSAVMSQPLPQFLEIINEREEISTLLSLGTSELADTPIQKVSCGVPYILVPIKNLKAVQEIQFRLDVWNRLKEKLNHCFIYAFTTETELPNSGVHGRMFAPEGGILEDPATGSANGPLGCYLNHYNLLSGPFQSEQGFEMGRPSLIQVEIVENEQGEISQVLVGGNAVSVGIGEFYI